MFKRSQALFAVGVLTVALVSACGSSSSKGGTSSTTGSSSPAAGGTSSTTGSSPASTGASGTPIVLGAIGSFSGPNASSTAGAEQVVKAWADSVNAAGGISGHPVKLIVKDDGNNLAAGVTAMKELVQQDHVVAIIGQISTSAAAWAPIASAAGVPVVGGETNDPTYLTDPNFYATGANVIAMFYETLVLAKQNGDKIGVLYCKEAPQCASSVALNQAVSPATGVKVAYSAGVSATAPDYTAVCQALKQSGAQSVEIGDSSQIVVRITKACQAQGVTAKSVTFDGTLTSPWQSEPAMDGTLAAEDVFPFFDSSVPATKAYQDAIAKYAPNLGDLNGPISATPWVAGKLFEAAVAASGSSDITPASVKAGLYKLHDETLGGLAPPLNFTEGKASLNNCTFTVGISGGKFTTPNGLNVSCAPSSVIDPIVAGLTKK